MENIAKIEIAIGLFTGVIISLFVIIGTIMGNFLWEVTKKFYEKYPIIFGLTIFVIFIGFGYITLRYALKILFYPSSTDFHSLGDILKKVFWIK